MEEFLGSIIIAGFNFAPVGFALCNGQLLAITQNTALFSLLGTYYGGDGISNFALPNLQGRVPVHQGSNSVGGVYNIGQQGGVEYVTLTTNQMPIHSHAVNVSNIEGNTGLPGVTTYLARGPITGSGPNAVAEKTYTTLAPATTLNPATIANAGGGQAFSVVSPYLCVNFIIALQGVFPSRN